MKTKHILLTLFLILFIAACRAKATPTESPQAEEAPTQMEATLTPSPVPPTATGTETPSATPTQVPPSATPTETEVPSLTANYPLAGYGPSNFPENINPLTGLPVKDPTILDRRPVAVKISNEPRGMRPNWGMSFADIVYQYYQEAGRTRFFTLFYGQNADEVGPIRSARYTDEELVRMYKAVFAFGSADIGVRNRLNYQEFWNRLAYPSDIACPPNTTFPTCRVDPNGFNHLMTDTDILSQHFTEVGVENGRQNLDGLAFNVPVPPDGEPGESLVARYSFVFYNKWEYDSKTGRYLRFQDASDDEDGSGETFAPFTDRVTGEQIGADNVIVLLARHDVYRREPTEVLNIYLYGFGKAYIFRDGQVYLVNWARLNNQDLITFTYDDGSRFPLKPGTTWIEIMGLTAPVTNDGADWRFQFQIP